MSRLGDSLNWVVLAAVLALPAGLYLYWQHNTALKRRAAIEQQASKTAPPGSAFDGAGEAPIGNPLHGEPAGQAPVSVATAAPAPAAFAAAPAGAREGAGPGAPQAPAIQDAPAAVETAPARPVEAAAQVQPSTAAPAGLFSPKSDRDPMDSISDKLQREMLEASRRTREAMRKEDDTRTTQAPRKKQPSIESRIRLEGIVEAPGGIAAIVNGELVRKGSSVLGAKIVRITQDSVTFNHKGKVFVKKIKR